MTRRLLPIAVIALIAFLGFEIAAQVASRHLDPAIEWYSPTAHERHGLLERTDWDAQPLHTVFAGSSQIGVGADVELYAELTGNNAVNMGLPNAGPHTVRRWLLEEVLPRTSPEVVVIGVSSFEFNINFENRAGPGYDGQLASRRSIGAVVSRAAQRQSALFAHRHTLSNPAKALRQLRAVPKTYQFESPMIDWPHPVLSPQDRDDQVDVFRNSVVRDFEVDEALLAELDDLLSQLIDGEVAPVIVYMPVTGRFIDAHSNGRSDFESVRDRVRGVAEKHDTPFLDLAEALPESAFYDIIHLTTDGAEQFTTLLVQRLQDNS